MTIRRLASERGIVLPIALMALMVLAAQAATLLAIGSSEAHIAANLVTATQALFLAEAGIEDAFNTLRTSGALAAAPAALGPLRGLAGPGPSLERFGAYDVLYQKAGLNTVRVVVTATLPRGGMKRLRATMTTQVGATRAIVTNGPLVIDGATRVLGRCGSLHANGSLTIASDLAEIRAGATATGTPRGTYRAVAGGDRIAPDVSSRVAIPSIRAAQLLAAAQSDPVASTALFRLTEDGAVLRWSATAQRYESYEDQATPSSARTILRGTRAGWEWVRGALDVPAQWRITGDSAPPGTFYVEGDVMITGEPGNSAVPGPAWFATLIAADTQPANAATRGGNVLVSGNPRLTAHLPDVVIAADRDVAIGGSPLAGTYTGMILAHEQIQIMGNATMTGALLAEDAETSSATVTESGVRISSSATITYDCGAVAPLDGPLTIVAWGP